jgi:hypothetical protein
MATLTGQCCRALVTQALLVDLLDCRYARGLRVLQQVRVAQWRPTGGLGCQLGA